jgi:hypothetical protein
MLQCPLCKASLDEGTTRCPADGRRPLRASVIEAAGDDPLLGATVGERYVILGVLGSGGMGTVYRAEQQGFGRQVALKLLRADLGLNPTTAARFQREARTLSQLTSRNTVTVFDFGQTPEGRLFLVMELLEGEMLSQRIKREGRLSVMESIRIAVGILRSLDEAHASGVVHRDLKPDNIFLQSTRASVTDPSDSVKVVDFGIAKVRPAEDGLDPLKTQEGTVFGTPRYMAPEQAQGRAIDGRADLYAVGLLLFQMLTGRPPFTEDDAVLVMAHHIRTIPPGVRAVASDQPIPPALDALVHRALSKDPARRPQTAAEFLALLEAAKGEAASVPAAIFPGGGSPRDDRVEDGAQPPGSPRGEAATATAPTDARDAEERRRWIPAAIFAAVGVGALAVGVLSTPSRPPRAPAQIRVSARVEPPRPPAVPVSTVPVTTTANALPVTLSPEAERSEASRPSPPPESVDSVGPDGGLGLTGGPSTLAAVRPSGRPAALPGSRAPRRARTAAPLVPSTPPVVHEAHAPISRWDD